MTSIGITGADASSFTQMNNCGTSVAASASCTITVTFKPTVSGALTAAVSIADGAYGSPQAIALSGPGSAVSFSGTGIGFVTTPIGVASTARSLTLTNKGSTALALTGIAITGAGASSYSQTNTCGSSLAAAGSCVISVTFTPVAIGLQLANISVTDGVDGSPQTATLSGAGTVVSLSSTSLTYVSTAIGDAAPAQTVTLTNKGSTALTITGIGITGTNAASFTETNTCGTSVAAAGSCAITVIFKPTAAGAATASVRIADNAYGAMQTIALNGTGQ